MNVSSVPNPRQLWKNQREREQGEQLQLQHKLNNLLSDDCSHLHPSQQLFVVQPSASPPIVQHNQTDDDILTWVNHITTGVADMPQGNARFQFMVDFRVSAACAAGPYVDMAHVVQSVMDDVRELCHGTGATVLCKMPHEAAPSPQGAVRACTALEAHNFISAVVMYFVSCPGRLIHAQAYHPGVRGLGYQITLQDVIFSDKAKNHEGNKTFQKLIKKHVSWFRNCRSEAHESQVIMYLVFHVRAYGGRFLVDVSDVAPHVRSRGVQGVDPAGVMLQTAEHGLIQHNIRLLAQCEAARSTTVQLQPTTNGVVNQQAQERKGRWVLSTARNNLPHSEQQKQQEEGANGRCSRELAKSGSSTSQKRHQNDEKLPNPSTTRGDKQHNLNGKIDGPKITPPLTKQPHKKACAAYDQTTLQPPATEAPSPAPSPAHVWFATWSSFEKNERMGDASSAGGSCGSNNTNGKRPLLVVPVATNKKGTGLIRSESESESQGIQSREDIVQRAAAPSYPKTFSALKDSSVGNTSSDGGSCGSDTKKRKIPLDEPPTTKKKSAYAADALRNKLAGSDDSYHKENLLRKPSASSSRSKQTPEITVVHSKRPAASLTTAVVDPAKISKVQTQSELNIPTELVAFFEPIPLIQKKQNYYLSKRLILSISQPQRIIGFLEDSDVVLHKAKNCFAGESEGNLALARRLRKIAESVVDGTTTLYEMESVVRELVESNRKMGRRCALYSEAGKHFTETKGIDDETIRIAALLWNILPNVKAPRAPRELVGEANERGKEHEKVVPEASAVRKLEASGLKATNGDCERKDGMRETSQRTQTNSGVDTKIPPDPSKLSRIESKGRISTGTLYPSSRNSHPKHQPPEHYAKTSYEADDESQLPSTFISSDDDEETSVSEYPDQSPQKHDQRCARSREHPNNGAQTKKRWDFFPILDSDDKYADQMREVDRNWKLVLHCVDDPSREPLVIDAESFQEIISVGVGRGVASTQATRNSN